MRLLADSELEQTDVVANCAMNRERRLASYAKELGFDPAPAAGAGWLDLCCGSGRALIEAAGRLPGVPIVGVDLVATYPADPPPTVTFVNAPLGGWAPGRTFDLITCVHGLHYVGDKLGALQRAAEWLTPTGRLVANLDVASIHLTDATGTRRVARSLREAGFTYDARHKRIELRGGREIRLPFHYLGADPKAGPNYTGQPAVNSHYAAR